MIASSVHVLLRVSPGRLAGLLALLCLCACATSTPHVNEFLDPRTGVTVTSSVAPLVLYRNNPAVAAYARNYVNLGPIKVNRMGAYTYFLWVGIWNTMEPADIRSRDGFESITLFADGEPFTLDLAGWSPSAIGTSLPVYRKPVASAADAYYRVTIDQIRLIAEADEIRLRTTGPSRREYQLWERQRSAYRSLKAFLSETLP